MSKHVKKFFTVISTNCDLSKLFAKNHSAGGRIAPSKNSKNDKQHEFRLNAGPVIDGRYQQVNLQINAEATGPALKKYREKHGAHAKLAVESFDKEAEDPAAEAQRVCESLQEQACEQISK